MHNIIQYINFVSYIYIINNDDLKNYTIYFAQY